MGKNFSIGDRVKLTKPKSVSHFTCCGLSIHGRIAEIRKFNMVSGSNRCLGIKFSDRPGVWFYAKDEVVKAPYAEI